MCNVILQRHPDLRVTKLSGNLSNCIASNKIHSNYTLVLAEDEHESTKLSALTKNRLRARNNHTMSIERINDIGSLRNCMFVVNFIAKILI